MDRNPNETARKLAENALSRLASELEAGRTEALMNYLAAMSRLQRHSWSNVLLISAQRPDATRVAGFHSWHDLGRTIKEGEKGIVIFVPAEGRLEPNPAQTQPQNDPFHQAGFRAAYAFDVAQTEGRPLPEFAQASVDVWKCGEQLRALVAKRGIELQIDRSIEPARGVSSGGKIRLKPGLSPVEWVSVLTHELAHEMLHHRPEAAPQSREAFYAVEAEAAGVAYVVARSLGIETPTDAAEFMAQYVRDKKAVAQTLAAIQETSAQILDELLPERPTAARRAAAGFSQPEARPTALNAEGFDKMHREYGDRLVQSIAGFVRDRDKAEDIAARAFQTAWEKRESFRGDSLPSTWLEAIARNEARNSLYRERTFHFDSIDREDARELAAPALVTDELEKRDDRFRLQHALARVPVKYRRALTPISLRAFQSAKSLGASACPSEPCSAEFIRRSNSSARRGRQPLHYRMLKSQRIRPHRQSQRNDKDCKCQNQTDTSTPQPSLLTL
jgi:RNA polymerase sigma factor (sigma-70 family)